MPLTQYNKKRDFNSTNEPFGMKEPSVNKKRVYAIQFHKASHDHYDLRLEMGGVLKSWAIPKEPPREKGTKRLAVQTEDHPMDYAFFEGEIPEGNYGAGEVKLWDKGTYTIINKDKKKIEIKIDGKKLKGNYVLIKTSYGSKPDKSWLFFKL